MKRIILLLIHIPVWIVAFFTAYFFSSDDLPSGKFEKLPYLVYTSISMAFWLLSSFYVFYSFLVPKYLAKRKYQYFTFFAALFVLVIIPAVILFLDFLSGQIFVTKEISQSRSNTNPIILSWLGCVIGALFCGGLGAFYRFATDWFKDLQIKKDLENKNLQSELKILKSKLNPHLLFNTLNNIDTLIQTSPGKASEILTKLSDLLRYVVYDTEKEKVPLLTEVDNLKKYIDLEKIRTVNPDSIVFTAQIDENTYIPPMIFFPFVENSFKHSNLNNKNHKLSISISDSNGIVRFDCINNRIEEEKEKGHIGIGLALATKRLELLFPNKHELLIQQNETEFIVKLLLKTN
jgi:two-component system, LytTR family, sensor kinase